MAPPKAKGQKMGLGEFLTDASLGSWADEMEDVPVLSGGSSARSGYGMDRSHADWSRSAVHPERSYQPRESLPLPTKPPYTVHLGNMSFDATEGDVQAFFDGCQVTNVRIVEDKVDRKPKGFGYAEFATLEGLKKALDYNGTQFQGRNIRVSVAEPQKERAESRELLDWTRKGPLPDLSSSKRSSDKSYPGPRAPDHPPELGGDRSRRPAFEQGEGKHRDFSNWERKGPLTPTVPPSGPGGNTSERQMSHEGAGDRRSSPAWGEGRSQDGSRPPRREFAERPAPERTPTAAELDNQWRSKMRPDPPIAASQAPPKKDVPVPTPVPLPAPPATRPKLNLQKRSVSQAETSPSLPTGTSDAKASPFGSARPIDTSAREKEIEQKMKQRKEHEDKVREEKKIAEEKVKEKRAANQAAKGEPKPEHVKSKANGQAKNAETNESVGKNYQILRRDAGDNESEIGEEKEEPSTPLPTERDKNVKPQEVKRDLNGLTSEDTSAEQLQEEGWSTVSKPKGRRGQNSATRAIAS